MPPRIEVKKQADVTLVLCQDALLNDELAIQEWGDQLMSIVENGTCQKLVLNFEKVRLMSSSALRILIMLQKKTDAGEIPFILCGLRDEILEVFKITNLDTLFNIRKGPEEAIRSFPYLGEKI
ncbi:MAG: STAS domain-containing protein [Planctomycetaceae bacterium]|jgi:anti-anti-sigma factor|nr:STAS domain-containing protein [Planctomycetaceae bacterium]